MKSNGSILVIGTQSKEKEVLIKRLEAKGYKKITISYALKKHKIPIFKKVIIPDDIVVDVIKQEVIYSTKPCVICDFPINLSQAKLLLKSSIKIDKLIILGGFEDSRILQFFEEAKINHIFLNSNKNYYDLEKKLVF